MVLAVAGLALQLVARRRDTCSHLESLLTWFCTVLFWFYINISPLNKHATGFSFLPVCSVLFHFVLFVEGVNMPCLEFFMYSGWDRTQRDPPASASHILGFNSRHVHHTKQ